MISIAPLLKYWKLALCLVVCIACFSSGYWLKGTIEQAKREAAIEAAALKMAADMKEANAHAESLEKSLTELRKRNRALNRLLDAERENPVYHSCVVPPSGVQLLNQAVTGSASPSQPNR